MPSARDMREESEGRAARTRASSCSMRPAMVSTTLVSLKGFLLGPGSGELPLPRGHLFSTPLYYHKQPIYVYIFTKIAL